MKYEPEMESFSKTLLKIINLKTNGKSNWY